MIISSKDNPRIKKFTKLSQSRSARNADGLFVLEGMRLITDAICEKAPFTCILATKKALSSPELRIPDGVETLCITDEIAAKISETHTPQGVFAICKVLDKINLSDTMYSKGKYVLLCGIQDPGNLGMIMRTADAMGMGGVFLSDCCDVYNPKVVRATMGSLFRIPFTRTSVSKAMKSFSLAGIKTFAAVIDGECDAASADFSSGSALLIGNEGNGLPKEIAGVCDSRITIKMHGKIDSLNAAMAAGILMYLMSSSE